MMNSSPVRLKRTFPFLLAVLAIAAILTAVVQLRRRAPPEAARLLPTADAFFYLNLKWVRAVHAVSQLPEVAHEGEYQQFLDETGFQFERDLDEAAFAIHYPESWRAGGTGGKAPEPRFSEVFVGRFDGQRLRSYLKKIAAAVDSYHGTEVYNIPLEGRTVRAAILNVDSVAVSNHDDPTVIRGIIDRSHKLASPFAGPAFLRKYYKSVPLASLSWLIAHVEPSANPLAFANWSLLFQKPAVVVVSARYLRDLHLRVEAFTNTQDDAETLTARIGTFINLFHAAENAVGVQGPDPDVKAFFDSLSVSTHGDRAVLTAAVPPGFLRKALAEPTQELAPAAPPSSQKAAKPPSGSSQKDMKTQD
jgi:hypothetical protein